MCTFPDGTPCKVGGGTDLKSARWLDADCDISAHGDFTMERAQWHLVFREKLPAEFLTSFWHRVVFGQFLTSTQNVISELRSLRKTKFPDYKVSISYDWRRTGHLCLSPNRNDSLNITVGFGLGW